MKAKAKERQATSTGGANPQLKEKFPGAGTQARDELGAMAGVSGKVCKRIFVFFRRKALSLLGYGRIKRMDREWTENGQRIKICKALSLLEYGRIDRYGQKIYRVIKNHNLVVANISPH